MSTFQISLLSAASAEVLGVGCLTFRRGVYELEITEGTLQGVKATGLCEARKEFGMVTHYLKEVISDRQIVPATILHEVNGTLKGRFMLLSDTQSCRAMLAGNRSQTATPIHGIEAA